MKKCKSCKQYSITKEMFWINGRCVYQKVCCNPYCKKYKPYAMYTWTE